MGDRYVNVVNDFLEEMDKKTVIKTARNLYKQGKKGQKSNYSKGISEPKSKSYFFTKVEKVAYARGKLEQAAKEGNIHDALTWASMYERIGKGYKPFVKNKLIEALKKEEELNNTPKDELKNEALKVKEYMERNQNRMARIIPIGSLLMILTSAFLFSKRMTGNVVNIESYEKVGLILAIFGISMGMMYLKNVFWD